MPELIQQDFTAENVVSYLRPWLTDAAANAKARSELSAAAALLDSGSDPIAKIVAISFRMPTCFTAGSGVKT